MTNDGVGMSNYRPWSLPRWESLTHQTTACDANFPYDKVESHAKDHRQTALLDEMNAPIMQEMEQLETLQKTLPVRLLLAGFSEPVLIATMSDG